MGFTIMQAAYWVVECIIVTFASVFLLSKGFNNSEIGTVMAVSCLLSLFIQPSVATAVDRSKRLTLKGATLIMAALTVLLSIGLFFTGHTEKLLIAVLYAMLFAVTITIEPFVNALGMALINEGVKLNFGLARSIGSFSFATSSMIMGHIITQYGIRTLSYAQVLLCLISVFTLCLFRAAKMKGPQRENEKTEYEAPDGELSFLRKYKRFIIFLFGMTLVVTAYKVSSNYMIQIVQRVGGDSSSMGLAIGISAFAEIPVMIFFISLISRFRSSSLIKISAICFSIKAILMFLSNSVTAIYFTQAFQALPYSFFVLGTAYYANEIMSVKDKAKGQVMVVLPGTLGNMLGSIVGGWLIDFSGVQSMLLYEAILSIIGTIIALSAIQGSRSPKSIANPESSS